MQSDYAQTLHSFATDLNNLWKDKRHDEHDKSNNDCSLDKFIMSASQNFSNNLRSKILPVELTERMQLVERLAKSASIWTRPELSRVESEIILNEHENGVFLVRMTSDQKTMVLTFKVLDRVQHVMIMLNLKKGFYMNGSSNVFRNVNLLIAHYMRHAIQNKVCLNLPRALNEATEPEHFKFFENMKIEFWRTSISKKGIDEIWPQRARRNASGASTSSSKYPSSNITGDFNAESTNPPLPPRGYEGMDLYFIQGSADVKCPEVPIYQIIDKSKQSKKPPVQNKPMKMPQQSDQQSTYSEVWNYQTPINAINTNKPELPPQIKLPDISSEYEQCWDTGLLGNLIANESDHAPLISSLSTSQRSQQTNNSRPTSNRQIQQQIEPQPPELPSTNRLSNKEQLSTIPSLIMEFYPQLVDPNFNCNNNFIGKRPSLQEEINRQRQSLSKSKSVMDRSLTLIDKSEVPNNEVVYESSSYETPWDIGNNWVTKLIDRDCSMAPDIAVNNLNLARQNSDGAIKYPTMPTEIPQKFDNCNESSSTRIYSSIGDPDQESLNEDFAEETKNDYLAELKPVVLSAEWENEYKMEDVCHYGQNIRIFLNNYCSRYGKSQISNSINIFIKCTLERSDLSPYTTMRLIRQYMSGLKNFINQQKQESSLANVIEEEKKRTPKNVFINLDVLVESVLTKEVLKPLTNHIYRLLILEHYKNNNLNLISDGVNVAKNLTPEKLGMNGSVVPLINKSLQDIIIKFQKMAATYSPERKIVHLVSIVDIIINLMNQVYSEDIRVNMKTDDLLAVFVYIFSQCPLHSVSAQCEVEFIEGLVWSSRLVNGEPGFFLLNLTSALEAIKVLGRPKLQNWEMLEISQPQVIEMSSFYTKQVNPTNFSQTAVGSVNVIIFDEKINRLVIKTFPVRSTVNVRNLCNTIAHRLGIFNPVDYCLFKFTGYEEIQLQDHECPLFVKQEYFQKTGEAIHFLFKRQNANFILPSNVIDG